MVTSALDGPEPQDAQDLVVKALEEEIIFGRLQPGTRLIEDALMDRFGATRHVVRSALFTLERTGIVVRERNRGAMVRSLTPMQVRKIYDVREMLQRQAALLIALPAPLDFVRGLEDIHERYVRAVRDSRHRDVHELNDAFHVALFSGCDNPYLVDSIKTYMFLSLPVRAKTMTNPELLQVSVNHHAAMIRLLEGSDNWSLAQLCVDHIQPAKGAYLAVTIPEPPGARAP
ncbi:GntR family transcriptional regulator [Betaproteobacteria bacterium GR16-43]|nr:GntR family transcriptional regulator [Betaproteobacteria bacterium GR16-43]